MKTQTHLRVPKKAGQVVQGKCCENLGVFLRGAGQNVHKCSDAGDAIAAEAPDDALVVQTAIDKSDVRNVSKMSS